MLSMEIRKIIIQDREDGMEIKAISQALRVSESAIHSLLRRKRETGSIEPSYQGNCGRPSKVTEEQRKEMEELVREQPDVTLEEIREKLELPIKKSQISNLLHEMGFRFKKKMIHASEQKRPDVVKQREDWEEQQKEMDSKKLVFLDESGLNIDMTRRYGRAKGQERVHDYAPLNKSQTLTMLSSVRLDGTMAMFHFPGALTGEIFLKYLKEALVPTLQKGDIVVLDNLSCHKVSGVREAIEGAGASVLYLPPYSPDFNPIELLWSKLKAIFRALKLRSFELLSSAIPVALDALSLSDIAAWFRHAGYSLS